VPPSPGGAVPSSHVHAYHSLAKFSPSGKMSGGPVRPKLSFVFPRKCPVGKLSGWGGSEKLSGVRV